MINRVLLVGRITKDAELQKTANGVSQCRFCLAVETKKDVTDFIDCKSWRQSAEFMSMYVRKGDIIGVDGKLNTYTFEKDGRKNKVTEVIADNVRLISRSNGGNSKEAENDLEKELPF